MGCAGSKGDSAVEKYLKQERRKFEREVKLLLLGAGESGKSTIAKQMKIIHLGGFEEEERKTYIPIIRANVIYNSKCLITGASDLGIKLDNEEVAKKIFEMDSSGPIHGDNAELLKALWRDRGIQEVYARQSEIQLNDSTEYYFEALDRIGSINYIPTEQDVLRSRAKTTGIIETEFEVENTKFRLVDVGGQRSERKKWLHCFQDVTAIVFCVAISEYDLKLYEDDSVNRILESLELFKSTVNNQWFNGEKSPSMILFFNKSDLFREKIRKVDLKVAFDDYTGGKDFENAYRFIESKFLQANENPKRQIYTHLTCATDTDNINVVFSAVQDIILRGTLDNVGLGICLLYTSPSPRDA
eukprot:TRINITY_DN4817_c0_g1_i1.p1 TRINITY_DN4817_c0_g1~~TRINITY_DN4817_c0_g1_i1.p1  ORF type:complete len:357 (-),score=84.82 TRINITY_DN4817_c0_g1_i1:14-1084(-)